MSLVFNHAQKDIMQDLVDKMEALRRCHLFASLEQLALKRMTLNFRLRTYRPHDVLFAEGDEIVATYLVVEGQVELFRKLKVGPCFHRYVFLVSLFLFTL